ncbi:TPA: hypothetical protein ACF373_004876 [Vibrio parahaemolyticus]|nr:hypothetical protein FORC23_3829 [Vibrio parahaemolyticus]
MAEVLPLMALAVPTTSPLKSVMVEQPAALASHFLFQKDERKLRAREVSLDSLPYKPLWLV